jgi:hypothetical protein
MTSFQEAVEIARSVHWERVAIAPLQAGERIVGTDEWRRLVSEGMRRMKSRPGRVRRTELDGCKDRTQYHREYMRLRRTGK